MTDYKIIACSTLRDEVEALRGDIPVDYLEGFLHDTPDVLREKINERIAATPDDCTILLGLRPLLQRHGRPGGRLAPPRPARLRRLHRHPPGLPARLHARVRRAPRHVLLHPRLDRGARGPVPRVPQGHPAHGRGEGAHGRAHDHGVVHARRRHRHRHLRPREGHEYVDTVSEFYGLPVEPARRLAAPAREAHPRAARRRVHRRGARAGARRGDLLGDLATVGAGARDAPNPVGCEACGCGCVPVPIERRRRG